MTAAGASAQVLGDVARGWSIQGSDPIEIVFGGRLVTKYHAGFEEGKPYFYPIMGPSGENMTRHWPMNPTFEDEEQDHPYHRGMWYGLGDVNGYDFWTRPEDPGADAADDASKRYGVIRHRGMNGVIIRGETITIKTRSDWLDAGDAEKRICSDRREFTLFYREDGSLALDLTLRLIADAGDITIGGGEDAGWAIRTIPTLRLRGGVAAGHILTSEGDQDGEAIDKRASWVDCHGSDRAGNPVGVAIFDHPDNLHSPTWWRVTDHGLLAANPFARGNFADGGAGPDEPGQAGEEKGGNLLRNGESLTFRYRTIFHEGDPESAGIAAAFEAFASK